MLSRKCGDRIRGAADDRRLMANAELLLPATLARFLGPIPGPDSWARRSRWTAIWTWAMPRPDQRRPT